MHLVLATQAAGPPELLVNASAIGFYGDRGEEILDEDSPAGSGFLAESCVAWEAATEPARQASIRVALLRIGVVLTPDPEFAEPSSLCGEEGTRATECLRTIPPRARATTKTRGASRSPPPVPPPASTLQWRKNESSSTD